MQRGGLESFPPAASHARPSIKVRATKDDECTKKPPESSALGCRLRVVQARSIFPAREWGGPCILPSSATPVVISRVSILASSGARCGRTGYPRLPFRHAIRKVNSSKSVATQHPSKFKRPPAHKDGGRGKCTCERSHRNNSSAEQCFRIWRNSTDGDNLHASQVSTTVREPPTRVTDHPPRTAPAASPFGGTCSVEATTGSSWHYCSTR